MGAQTFSNKGTGKTVAEAFLALVEQAYWNHGHAGYTGTIAEKDRYVEFAVPTGADVDRIEDALIQYEGSEAERDYLIGLYGAPTAAKLFDTYNDKWGPAVALRISDTEWQFCGWASY